MTEAQARSTKPHRVVIVGAGFGGLEAAHRLAGAPVSITLIDRRNHHLFQPLLYQVATAALATFVMIGAGPTGVELAGTIAELAQDTLPPDFRNIDTHKTRVVLIEAGPRVLAGFADDLSAYAQRALESIGVEVMLGQAVTECNADGVVYGGNRLDTKTIIWAAGVRASPAAEWLGAPADRAGRLQVLPDLTVPGHPDIFAIGDTVTINGPDGKPVPGIAPAAKQQ